MKIKYEAPKVEIVELNKEDIIVCSKYGSPLAGDREIDGTKL